jgi:PilZ domain
MPRPEDKIFFRIPKRDTPNKRVLRPCVVLAVEGDVYLIRLEEPCSAIEVATDVALHFEERRKFWQQSGRIVRQDPTEPLVFGVQLQGAPVSAEARQCFRVSCLGSNIRATIDGEEGCEVVDLSATGFAFYGRRDYDLGTRMRVALTHDGRSYQGHGTIQSSRRMTPKTTRYGVHCTDTSQDTLARSLAAINLSVQAEQQRRMAAKGSG